MNELFDSEFLDKIRRLAITSRITVSGGMGGNRKSRSKGASVEFSDYREYSAGDDFRRIDWNAYGRFEKLFIKLFMEEREAPVNIFIDASQSMKWGNPDKSVASRKLAAALGCMALSNYDRLSIFALSDQPKSSIASLRGRQGFARILDFLVKMEYGGKTALADAIKKCKLKNDRGISLVISDMFSDQPLNEALKYLRFRKQQLYVFHILSPDEIRPEFESAISLVDSETGQERNIVVTADLLKAYSRRYDEFVESVRKACFEQGAEYVFFDSSAPIESMVRRVAGA